MQYIATVIEDNKIVTCLACETLEQAMLKAEALFILGEGRKMNSEEAHRLASDGKVNVGGHYLPTPVYGVSLVIYTN